MKRIFGPRWDTLTRGMQAFEMKRYIADKPFGACAGDGDVKKFNFLMLAIAWVATASPAELESDRDEHYKDFISLTYDYSEGDGKANTFGLQNPGIWTPQDSSQQHLMADVIYGSWTVYMTFSGEYKDWEPKPGSYEVIVNTHPHDETFISNYNTEIYKYDFETGKPLANSEFEILEKGL